MLHHFPFPLQLFGEVRPRKCTVHRRGPRRVTVCQFHFSDSENLHIFGLKRKSHPTQVKSFQQISWPTQHSGHLRWAAACFLILAKLNKHNYIRQLQSQMQNILFPGVADRHSCRSDGVCSKMHPGIIPQGNLYTGISHHGNMHLGKNVFKDRDTLPPLDQLVKASTCVLKVQFMRFVSYTRNRIITISKVLFLFAFTLESTYACRSLVLRIILALL